MAKEEVELDMNEPNVMCAHDELVDLVRLQPNPKNPNGHPKRQIEMLAKIISYQGQRAPIVVSKRSGFIVKGHGRLDDYNFVGLEPKYVCGMSVPPFMMQRVAAEIERQWFSKDKP